MDRLKEIWQHPAWRETPVLVLYGDEDQYVPSFVDKLEMIQRWRDIHGSQVSKRVASKSVFRVLEYANHELSDERFILYWNLAYFSGRGMKCACWCWIFLERLRSNQAAREMKMENYKLRL
jgi:hypothetical protein